MNNPIDKLFNSKLARHTVSPSPMAWDKIDTAISKKNKGLVWVRIAAILLVGLFLGTVVWFQSGKRNSVTDSLTQVDSKEESKQTVGETIISQENNKPSSIDSKKNRIKTKRKLKSTENLGKMEGQQKKEMPVPEITLQLDNSIAVSQDVLVTDKVAARKSIVLEYRLDNITTPSRAEEQAEFASVEPKSGFKKAIDYAIGVKNGDSTLFSIRHAKENLFALNFKKDKKNITNQ